MKRSCTAAALMILMAMGVAAPANASGLHLKWIWLAPRCAQYRDELPNGTFTQWSPVVHNRPGRCHYIHHVTIHEK